MKYEEDNIEFWEQHYIDESTGWDLGGVTPVFNSLSKQLKPGKLCILGCGRGYDAVMFAHAGFEVTAVDFSPTAIKFVNEIAKKEKLSINAVEADIFDLLPEFENSFDYIIEQTCFCAINPGRRKEYSDLVFKLLKPGGKLTALWFPLDKKLADGGPPYATGIQEVKKLFSSGWTVIREEFPDLSIETRKGREKLIIFQKNHD